MTFELDQPTLSILRKSALLIGVGEDAAYIASHIAERA